MGADRSISPNSLRLSATRLNERHDGGFRGTSPCADRFEMGNTRHYIMLALTSCVLAAGCRTLGFFDEQPPHRCETPGRQEQLPCGPCYLGLQLRVCGENFLWRPEGQCLNPYDLDGDGFPNADCQRFEEDAECCGQLDCDDNEPLRMPGAKVDLDGDDHFDARCCAEADDPWCDDCNDEDDDLWKHHADRDGDGHHDILCGGDDCDDRNADRWWNHADVDGDGHIDVRCCDPGTSRCDDCNDDDPRRWLQHADLDGDGHVDVSCGGDDCDDEHPQRWIGHADVDGDGHVDDRCCPEGSERLCDDCNDNDPRRWTGHADLDGDGYDSGRCSCRWPGDPLCSEIPDCDDDCATCYPGAEPDKGDARDHDCDGVVDAFEMSTCRPGEVTLISRVETGNTNSVLVVDELAYVASDDGLFEVDVHDLTRPLITSHLDTGATRDVAIYRDLVFAATVSGLLVLDRAGGADLSRLAGPIDVGDSRAVTAQAEEVMVASHRGLYMFDVSDPVQPVQVSALEAPVLSEVNDVVITPWREQELFLFVTSRALGRVSETEGGAALVKAYPRGGMQIANSVAIENPVASAMNPTEGFCVVTQSELVFFSGPILHLFKRHDVEGAQGLEMAIVDNDPFAFIPTSTGLKWFDSFVSREYFFETPAARDVFVSDSLGYVATEEGLWILSFGCTS